MRIPNVKFCLASSCMLALLISVFASAAQTSESDVQADETTTTTIPTQSPGTGGSRTIQGNETGQLADHAAVGGPLKPVPSGPADTDTRKPQSKKIVCFGDSITKWGYPEHLAKILGVRVVNAGVAGNTTRHALRRLKSDVLDQRPDAVVIRFGTNDSRMAEERVHVSLERYESNLDAMIIECRKENIAVVVGTIPPIDADAYFTRHASENFDRAGGFRKVLEAYRQAVLRLAANHQAPVVDLYRLLADQPGWRHQDGVHPTSEGNKVIATLVAKEVRRLVTSSAAPCHSAARDVKQQVEANVAVAAPSEDG